MAAKNHMNDGFIMLYSDIVFDESILKSMLNFQGKIGIAVDMDWKKKYKKRTKHPITDADNVIIKSANITHTKQFISKTNYGKMNFILKELMLLKGKEF